MTDTALATDDPWRVDATDVARCLSTDPVSGLTFAESLDRLARVGPNRVESAPELPAWRRFLATFADPVVYLLLVATGASLASWALDGATGVPFEAIVIAVIIVFNGVLRFVQERKAERAAAALEEMVAPAAVVVRESREVRFPPRRSFRATSSCFARGTSSSRTADSSRRSR